MIEEDFNITKEGNTTVIRIIDKFWEFEENDWFTMKTFMFDFLTECMKKHTEQGYLHSNNIDEILTKYKP
jgi:hypothetical protein